MTKIINISFVVVIVLTFVFSSFIGATFVSAQTTTTQTATQSKIYEYTVLTPLPGTTKGTCAKPGDPGCKTDMVTYIQGMFKLLIGLSIAFVFINFIIGGFQYITSQAMPGKKDGKDRIMNSLKGLALVAASWLILNTINKNLLNVDFTIESTRIAAYRINGTIGSSTPRGVAMPATQVSASNALRESLKSSGVDTYAGPCAEGQTKGCVNLNGLRDSTIYGITTLKKTTGGNITITGGTEDGHSSTGGHSDGRSLDVRYESKLDQYVFKNGGTPLKTNKGDLYRDVVIDNKGTKANFLRETNPEHWHITFP